MYGHAISKQNQQFHQVWNLTENSFFDLLLVFLFVKIRLIRSCNEDSIDNEGFSIKLFNCISSQCDALEPGQQPEPGSTNSALPLYAIFLITAGVILLIALVVTLVVCFYRKLLPRDGTALFY